MVLHIISRDKFTNGYIRFMKQRFPEYEHLFFSEINAWPVECIPEHIEINNMFRLVNNYSAFFSRAEKIIVSGASGWKYLPELEKKGYITKTYFQFWGADFYDLRERARSLKEVLKRKIRFHAYRHCAGLIFLIDNEYEKFVEITHIQNRHFVAPMPEDPDNNIDINRLRDLSKLRRGEKKETINILVGNSATRTNRHEEVFHMLMHLDYKRIKVFCPLSYGDDAYRERIIEIGHRQFNNAFNPITEYLDKESYYAFLSNMDVGIFNNDRQQAIFNINTMLGLGKKVYLNPKTSMWENYVNRGYVIFSIDELINQTIDEMNRFDEAHREKNIRINDETDYDLMATQKWRIVFMDNPIQGAN